jgi:uncharacterized membrane protein YcaP (DUF421 family)
VELVVRATVMFAVVWFITRVVGKRELGQLSAFELVLLVAMGDLIQQSVTQEDYSLTGGILVVSTFAMLTVTLSYVSWRFPRTRTVIDGTSTVVLKDGEPEHKVLRYERLPMDELVEAARAKGFRDLDEIQLAVLEPNGTFTFFKRDAGGEDGGTPPGSAS